MSRTVFDAFPLAELKLVYNVLYVHLLEHAELMDTEFFGDLQAYLQKQAQQSGIDLADHAAWAGWLK